MSFNVVNMSQLQSLAPVAGSNNQGQIQLQQAPTMTTGALQIAPGSTATQTTSTGHLQYMTQGGAVVQSTPAGHVQHTSPTGQVTQSLAEPGGSPGAAAPDQAVRNTINQQTGLVGFGNV